MKIAVIGGAGFIGSSITKAYLDAGHDVVVLDNLSHGSPDAVDARARFYSVDVRDSRVHEIFQQERPRIVSYHAAHYYRGVHEQAMADADIHIRGLLNVLEGCIAAQVDKIIFASNGNSLYGPLKEAKLPATEEMPLHPCRPLDISKVACEWYIRHYTRTYGLHHTILRYADVYGETDSSFLQHPLSYFVQELVARRRPILRAPNHVLRDHIFIDDVVRANLLALLRGDNETLHISAGQGCTNYQLFRVASILLESQLEPVYVGSETQSEIGSLVLSNERAHRLLGWTPEVNMVQGVQRAVSMLHTVLQEQVTLQVARVAHR
jgi:UDP-glucose 4-epimerase